MRLFISTLFRFLLCLVFFILLLITVCLSFTPTPAPQSSATLATKIHRLHETAAIWVPHFDIDEGKRRHQHKTIFEKVEQGEKLTSTEGQEYRQIYQELLFENQTFFRRFDSQLVAIADLEMNQPNNIGSQGVEGHHDHHDQSSRNNFMQIEKSYAALNAQSVTTTHFFSLARIKHAITIYKNLNDILFHLATVPHTKSIHYQPLAEDLSPEGQLFESMLQDFKAAQFMEINSAEYQTKISHALVEYQQLISISEARVHQYLSPIELKIVGCWGGWQSLTPKVSDQVVDY